MASNDKTPAAPRYADGSAHFNMGEHTLKVPMTLHAENRKRLLNRVTGRNVAPRSVVLLQGGEDTTRYSADAENVFRQETYFHWPRRVGARVVWGGGGRDWPHCALLSPPT
ncbi:xaa-Pro dipeptidase-like [Homarus americanus]|uniref:xaa-Pro dipeptidase-like n=1 Tax=Homarus americanus TaxID=6706 RepID=UPI001C48159F|nr:xaa-Pro dipeptidase-like [Homarus americanus]